MLPPRSSDLLRRVTARNAQRLQLVSARLADFADSRGRRHACLALQATLETLRGDRRHRFLFGTDLRDWLATAEEAFALARPLEEDADLFERAAAGPHLQELLPRGRLDAGFRGRVVALGERLLDRCYRRLPAVLAFLTPPRARYGPFEIDTRADGEEARRAGEVHLGFPLPGTLSVASDARLELVDGGVRILQQGRGARWKPRELIPGSGIVLARRVAWSRHGFTPRAPVPGLAERLGSALDLVQRAWPAAYREIGIHTMEVVPLREKGVVSFSMPARPGASYINVDGKSLVQLADDLLHEAAHHRLHSLEELGPLHRADDEAIYYSPWRRAMRPLRGILHASYTFMFRAELFRRMLQTRARLPRAWMRREADKEVRWLRRALVDLDDAASRGLLTSAGRRLLAALTRKLHTL